MVTNQLMAGDCRMLCEEHCSYEIRCLVSHLCVMAGWRLAVGFLQIVPGVFPTGVYTDRLPAAVVIFYHCIVLPCDRGILESKLGKGLQP